MIKRYVVAATPRSGSSLLCEGLAATGVAGRPNEPFAPNFRGAWLRYLDVAEGAGFGAYYRAALRYGTTANGVYGVKLQWMHVPELAAEARVAGGTDAVLERLFPDAAFVNIVRRDRRAQALSWFRAEATYEWWRFCGAGTPPSGHEPELDRDAVIGWEVEIERQQRAWEDYLARRAIEPLVVEYETLDRDYRGQVARTLEFLDLDPSAARAIPAPRLVRQADGLTKRWRQAMEAA